MIISLATSSVRKCRVPLVSSQFRGSKARQFVNDAELVHFSYQRFLENQIRMHHAFEGTPIKLVFRNRSES